MIYYHVVNAEEDIGKFLKDGLVPSEPYTEPGNKAVFLWDNIKAAHQYGDYLEEGEGGTPYAILQVNLPDGIPVDSRQSAIGYTEYLVRQIIPPEYLKEIYNQLGGKTMTMKQSMEKWLDDVSPDAKQWIPACRLFSDKDEVRALCMKMAGELESGKIDHQEFLASIANMTGKTLDELSDILDKVATEEPADESDTPSPVVQETYTQVYIAEAIANKAEPGYDIISKDNVVVDHRAKFIDAVKRGFEICQTVYLGRPGNVATRALNPEEVKL